MQNDNQKCSPISIVSEGLGEVNVCQDCSVVQLSLQFMSMRFAPESFRALVQMLNEAQQRIDELRHALPMSADRASHIHNLPNDAKKLH